MGLGILPHVRLVLPAQPVDATPSNALIRQCFPGRSDLFGCPRSKPSQSSVPADLTLASDLAFVFNASQVRLECCVDPLRPPEFNGQFAPNCSSESEGCSGTPLVGFRFAKTGFLPKEEEPRAIGKTDQGSAGNAGLGRRVGERLLVCFLEEDRWRYAFDNSGLVKVDSIFDPHRLCHATS